MNKRSEASDWLVDLDRDTATVLKVNQCRLLEEPKLAQAPSINGCESDHSYSPQLIHKHNNKPEKRAGNNSWSNKYSYSKIFKQYLPQSLNYSLNQSKCNDDRNKQSDNKLDRSPVTKSIANALSKIRISTNSSRSSKLVVDGSGRHLIQAHSHPVEESISSSSKLKRKGFLYLNTWGDANQSKEKSCVWTSRSSSGSSSTQDQTRIKKRDLNNNSIASLLSSGCQHDEHKTCLLDEDDKDDQTEAKSTRKEDPRDKIEMDLQDPNNKRPTGSVKGRNGNSKQTLVAVSGCLMVLALVAFMSGRIVLAQQQAPPFRSQPSTPAGQFGSPVGQGTSPSRVAPLPQPQPAAGSLVANVNCNKIRGHVTLTPSLQGGITTVSTQITAGPPGEVYQWSIHQFPVKPGAAMCSCSPLILGTKLLDLSEMHGNLPSDQEFNVQSSLSLFGSESPVGHSLLLRGIKTGMVACATFLPTSRKSNYRAKFHTPLSGSVTIFQTAFGTSFISHLMYSNGTRRHSQHRFDLFRSDDDIVTSSLQSGAQAGAIQGGSVARGDQDQERELDNELSQCKHLTNGDALFKNNSYQLSVSTENFGMRGRTSLVLPQIPFETFASVYVIVYSEWDPSEPIACAPLKFVKPKAAAAKFHSVSVQGSVVFSQDSPYDATVARINLQLPNSDGHSYGIDELPMIIRRKSDTRVCPNIREIIYNPHHVEPSSVPPEGEATSDQYAVGDLSGKYGSLTGKASEKIQVNDYNLPLFGPISIVGRAMTVYSADGVAIACSNVELTTPMTTAFATFDFGIQGQFIFRQPQNDCNGDTYVYIEVSKPLASAGAQSGGALSSDQSRSLDHNWHIHMNAVDSGLDHLSTTDCSPAGPHYNPYNTSTSSIYTRDCTPFNVLRCELGDMSAKMFTIEIPPYRVKGGQEPDIGKFFGTDIDLPLCGPVSIINRSVVVHVQDFGLQRLACSTVIEFKPRTS